MRAEPIADDPSKRFISLLPLERREVVETCLVQVRGPRLKLVLQNLSEHATRGFPSDCFAVYDGLVASLAARVASTAGSEVES